MKIYEVRYVSDIACGMALFDTYENIADARNAAEALRRRFLAAGLSREAKSVCVR